MIDPRTALDRTTLVLKDYVSATEEQIVATLLQLRIEFRASAATLAAPSAVAALVAAFESVARLGAEVVLSIPRDVRVGAVVPPLNEGSLFDSLASIAGRLIRPIGAAGPCDLCFTLDDVPREGEMALGGGDFEARLRVGAAAGGWEGSLPFGAMLAGSFAGAEVARVAVRRLLEAGAEPVDQIPLDHRDITLSLAPFEYPVAGIDLGHVDFVSAGAITHAALFALARVPDLRLEGRILDDDIAAEDNLNRYVLLDADGLGRRKEDHLVELDWPGFLLKAVHGRVGEDELSSIALANRVCVGVDSVPARWNIQRLAPAWIAVGATTHALAMASEHWPGTPCAGCVHAEAGVLARRLPTISFVSMLAGALLAYRLVRSVVAPITATEVSVVLDAFKLAAAEPFLVEHPAAHRHCQVPCVASLAA